MSDVLLGTNGLTKRYGEITVLRDVSLEVKAGEIHALLGANGAGKSTFCKIISGLIPASDGEMHLSGSAYRPRSKLDAESCGIEMVQQELNLIGTLSVAENLFLSRLPNRVGMLQFKKMHHEARDILDRFGLRDVSTHTKVESLGIGRRQMLEIAIAMSRECKLLILDEPTAALSGRESEQLFQHLDELRDRGIGMIYISHRLDEVAMLTDRVTVLRDGSLVTTQATADLSVDEMVDLMSNNASEPNKAAFTSHRTSKLALRVRKLVSGIVRDVSFDVLRGQKFGITGLVGSGRTELLRAIFGADIAESGELFVGDNHESQLFRHPKDAVAAGLAFVTEDRKENGLLLSQSVSFNTTLGSLLKKFSRFGCLKTSLEQTQSLRLVKTLDTQCESVYQSVATLSGGNQQKVAISKWLLCDGDVILFDEPTRGIDVAARQRIYRLIDSLVAAEKACVIVSSDLEELFETCDTIAVMCEGRMVDVFERDDWSHDKILQASFARQLA